MDRVSGLVCPKIDCTQGTECSAWLLTMPRDGQCPGRPMMPGNRLCPGAGGDRGVTEPKRLFSETLEDPLCLGLIHAQDSAYHGCLRADWTHGYPAQGLIMPATGYAEPDCARD